MDHVQITVAESIGVESRGAFYEETGASRDILQNHLLQLMTLVAMEPPSSFDADALRDEKLAGPARHRARRMPEHVRRDVVRGQYGPGWVAGEAAAGYRQEPEVDPESETETLRGRPLRDRRLALERRPVLPAGRQAAAQARHRDRDPVQGSAAAALPRSAGDPAPNVLAMRIQPDEGIMLRFAAKVPGLGLDVRTVNMDFAYGTSFAVDSPDAYETLILDALLGDASLFTRADEVEAAWSVVTPIIDGLGGDAGAALPRLRRGNVGPGGGRRADGTGRQTVAQDLRGPGRPLRVPGGCRRGRAAGRPLRARDRDVQLAPDRRGRAPKKPRAAREASGAGRRKHVAARSSVLNLVVVAGHRETAERCAATIAGTAGRRPSRSLILSAVDPDGPPGLDARIEALALAIGHGPRRDRRRDDPCDRAHGETGQHLASIIVPLLVHDLPVALWWPDDPRIRLASRRPAAADRPTG